MGLLDLAKKYFSREQQEVYCQHCGTELTERGGDVSHSGRIYCHGYNGVEDSCGIKALLGERSEVMVLNFYGPAQVQKVIRKSELTQFGPLEQVVADSLGITPVN